MSDQLEYQECYHKLAHESVINTMVLSPDGHRLVTGSDDCTVIVWSTQSGDMLCRIKVHSPVLSLAWLTDSNGFLLGCKTGMLASVNITEHHVKTTFFRAHSAEIRCISPKFNDVFPISATKELVKIWRRAGRTDLQHVENWELKVKLPAPSMIYRDQEVVEVTSVNWESKDAAVVASRVVVSYRWHGIVCWDATKLTTLWKLSIGECDTFSLSPDGRFAATFAPLKYFEVRDLKLGTVQRMQVPIVPTSAHHDEPETRRKSITNRPLCFAHEGFAVAGASNESQLHVWDAEQGDQLLSLDHGVGSKVRAVVATYLDDEDKFLIVTGTEKYGTTEKHGTSHIFLWVTAPRGNTTHTIAGQRFELGFTGGFWVNTLFMVVLAVVLAVSRPLL